MSSSHAMCFTCLQAMSAKISLGSQLWWCYRGIKASPFVHLALLPPQPLPWTTICLLECKLAFAHVYEPTCGSTKLPTFKVALKCEIICVFAWEFATLTYQLALKFEAMSSWSFVVLKVVEFLGDGEFMKFQFNTINKGPNLRI
jgi:hypothetical protein